MVLGDNIFYVNGLRTLLKAAAKDAEHNSSVAVCYYYESDPELFSVVAFDKNGRVIFAKI